MKQERQSKRRRFQSKCVWGGWCCDVSSRKGRRSRGKEAGGGSKTTPGQEAPCHRGRDEAAEARRLEEGARPHRGRRLRAGLALGLRAEWEAAPGGRNRRGGGLGGPSREAGL